MAVGKRESCVCACTRYLAMNLSIGAPVHCFFFFFFPANWFSSHINAVRPFAESFCLHIRVAMLCRVYGLLNVFTVFAVCLTGIIEFAKNSWLHILKSCLGLPSRSVHHIDRLFIKGGGGVRWRRGESRAEWQVVGKQWVSHWLTRWKLNTGPRLVSQQESACCLGASVQFIGHAGTLHLPNPGLICMDFLRLIPDLRDARVLLI